MKTLFNYHPPALQNILKKILGALIQPGKIILDTCKLEELRVGSVIDNNENNNVSKLSSEIQKKSITEILFSTPSLSIYVSGVVINEECKSNLTSNGLPIVNLFQQNRIIPGINLNKTIIKLNGPMTGWTSEGLDDLGLRCKQYKNDGFHFAHWNIKLEVSFLMPNVQTVKENANVLARFVSICQAYQIVPIVNTDIIQIGMHDITQSQKVTETVLATVFKAFNDYHVFLEGLILRTNILTHGDFCKTEISIQEIAHATISALRRTVPVSVGGVVFSINYQEQNCLINANNFVKYIKHKYDSLYTITFITNKLDRYSSRKNTINEDQDEVSNIQKEFINCICQLSKASLGEFHETKVQDIAELGKNNL